MFFSKKKKKGEGEKTGKRKREGDVFRGVEECGYSGGQDLILITLDRHECFSVFNKNSTLKEKRDKKRGRKEKGGKEGEK